MYLGLLLMFVNFIALFWLLSSLCLNIHLRSLPTGVNFPVVSLILIISNGAFRNIRLPSASNAIYGAQRKTG